MKSVFRFIFSCFIVFQPVYSQEVTQAAINRVIDKIMADTDFELTVNVQQASETVQSVQLPNFNSHLSSPFFYALSFVECAEECIYSLGFAANNPGEIFVNTEKIAISNPNSGFWFSEFAYDKYNFPNKTQAFFKKGRNTVLIKSTTAKSPAFYMAVLENNAEISPKLKFSSAPYSKSENSNWFICFTTDSLLHKYDSPVNAVHSTWFTPEIPLISKLMAGSNASFKKHSYVEWHYSNGATLWSILNFAGKTQNTVYEDFVKKCCDFNIRNYEKFKTQYYQLNDIHGYNHRLYRLQMLDDSSAPALPYLKLYTENKLNNADFILKKVEDFVVNKQARLSDGTFCRPEPWNESVWADDLFMSVPYLMMLGKSTGNKKYYDDAAFQVISFYKHLYDKKTGLCRHGWVNSPAKDSIPYWSRANGWMIWATSEVLLNLPKSHKDYKTIQNIFVNHVEGLLKWQNNEGFLHQLLNDSNSFTETSSTAMLTIALARGINNGWLSEKYKKQALKSWNAVLSRIETDGNVKGICEGTSIFTNRDYYLNRRTMDHDPRGLGAVITAGTEILKLTHANLNQPNNIDSIPRDNYYTIESAEKKVLKSYPNISRVNTNDLTGIKSDLNMVYKTINNRKLHMDIYRPMHSIKKNPAIILIHGGAWRSGNRSMETVMAMHLASHGYVTATIEYRLSPESKYPAAVYDLKSAISWLRVNALHYNIDTAKVGAYGCSSGGHLAALLGVTNGLKKFEDLSLYSKCSSNIQAVVNVDGPLDLTHPEESGRDSDSTKPSACKRWFGYSFNERPDLWIEASPVNYVSDKTVPIAFINSSLVQYQAGQNEMILKLKANKINYLVCTINDSPHSFWLFNPWFNETLKFTVDFFDKYLKDY